MLAFALIVAVKAFLMSAIGMEAYGAAVAQLLAGSDLERVAGLILAPDAVSLWVVDGYEAVSRLVTDALARSAA
ncbi:hypothetical protein roselon_01859 [Roseibacterium elongatum DSM 19469]|uniref:Uncharacterized protein n=2 Tax=Roseicyclus elongatus TaxID=159346 RepID=W8S202_9RHOB|nr:hypothetical protein roselon_01859 [Roseibacterium elongatum DSM 19469]